MFPDPAERHRIAELQWTATSQSADPLSAHIEARHTNRRFYQRTRLSTARLEQLNAAALRVPGTQLRWLDAPAQRRPALRAIRLAETERFKQRELHHELFSAVRFDVGWKPAPIQDGGGHRAVRARGCRRLGQTRGAGANSLGVERCDWRIKWSHSLLALSTGQGVGAGHHDL